MSELFTALRLRFFPQWKNPYAFASVFDLQQMRRATEQEYPWFIHHLAEL